MRDDGPRARERRPALGRDDRLATAQGAELCTPFMTRNARPQPRRAQLPGGVQHAAPEDLVKTEMTGLTAMGRTQRVLIEATWARRAPRKPEARREALTAATALNMKRMLRV